MGFFSRLLGICRTKPPLDPDCWSVKDGTIEVQLSRVPELSVAGGAVRIEGKDSPQRVLLFKADDGQLKAFVNRCPHLKRRLDPLAGKGVVECCSIGKSTFSYDGRHLSGFAVHDIQPLEVTTSGDVVTIHLD